MRRYFFVDDNLDHIELIERKLVARGMLRSQVHVLSQDDTGMTLHQLNEVHSLLRQDVIHSGEIGALIGLVIAILSVAVAYVSGLPNTIGWMPFVLFMVILLGFFTWEGGLFGIQVPNSQFRRFGDALRAGRHVLFVDVDRGQEYLLQQVLADHPHMKPEGTGIAVPRWLVRARQRWSDFLQWAP